ncbi:MAG TPA: FAD-binding oxidoreductase [Candidatus Dormibacteraeota bacterium]|nr:FAD-binding oxidoreductase [Candidatus Dormibacteraeota bacterium]
MTLATISVASRLAEITGASNVTSDPAQLVAYGIDGKVPAAAVKPGSRDEISEIVKFAAAEHLAIVPCGARSKLAMGAPPSRYDVALDVTRLDHIVAYDPSDLTLSVEPGIPLQRLAGVLAGHRQFLPLAVPFLSRATAGGTVAAGVHSPLRQAYGTARDFLLGVEFVTGEGVQAKSGGLVVKNVAGYDLHKLTIGSLGTLGIITKINFRTFPAPASTRVFAASSDSADGVLDMRRRIAQSPLRPLTANMLSPGSVEMLASGPAARIEPGPTPVDGLPKSQWAFLATFAGAGAVLVRYESELRRIADEAGCGSCTIYGDDEKPASFGRLREFVPIALESSPATTIIKLSVVRSKLKDILEGIEHAARANELRWAAMADGLGVIYAALLPSARDEQARVRVAKASERINGACAQLGGNVTIPFCPSEWKSTLKIWGPERGDFEQIRKLKKVFDPADVLAPGRFAGGI